MHIHKYSYSSRELKEKLNQWVVDRGLISGIILEAWESSIIVPSRFALVPLHLVYCGTPCIQGCAYPHPLVRTLTPGSTAMERFGPMFSRVLSALMSVFLPDFPSPPPAQWRRMRAHAHMDTQTCMHTHSYNYVRILAAKCSARAL